MVVGSSPTDPIMFHINETPKSKCYECGNEFELLDPPTYEPFSPIADTPEKYDKIGGYCKVSEGQAEFRCPSCQAKYRISQNP